MWEVGAKSSNHINLFFHKLPFKASPWGFYLVGWAESFSILITCLPAATNGLSTTSGLMMSDNLHLLAEQLENEPYVISYCYVMPVQSKAFCRDGHADYCLLSACRRVVSYNNAGNTLGEGEAPNCQQNHRACFWASGFILNSLLSFFNIWGDYKSQLERVDLSSPSPSPPPEIT